MKQILSLTLALLPCLAWAQYPSNGNQKITLGEQTTADGLVYRGVLADTGIITPLSDTSAYIILDTVNHRFYNYNRATNVWSVAGGGTAVTSITGGTGLTGGTITTSGTLAADTSFLFTQSDTLSLNLTSRFAAKQNTLTLTTIGTSGASTLTGVTLNIPQYSGIDSTAIKYVNTYGTQTVNGAKTLTSNLILKNSTEPSRSTVVTSQTFGADTTNWTRGTGWSFNGTVAVATAATGDLTYTPSLTITNGNAYEITYSISSYSSGSLSLKVGNSTYSLPIYNITNDKIILAPTSSTGGFRFSTSTFTGNLDNVTVVEISNSSSVIFAGQDDNSSTLYNSLRMPNSSTLAFGTGGRYTTGTANNFFGLNAGLYNTTGQRNNFFGQSCGLYNSTGEYNNFFGYNSGVYNTTGYNNNFFGFQVGLYNIDGFSNNFFGPEAGGNNKSGFQNNFFGANAGYQNTTGFRNNFFGLSAGINNTTGSGNDFFGSSAGAGNTTGFANMFFGQNSGSQQSGANALTGSNNISFGTNSGDNIVGAATNNLTIGVDIDLPSASGSNQLNIKNIIFGTGASGTGTTIAGNIGIAVNAPSARLHLVAGTASANTAPLKFTSGTNLTTAEAGAMEFNGTNLFFSPSTTRHTVNHGLTGSATLDFGSTNAQLSADLTITVTGASDGDVVSIGVPNAAVNANTSYSAWVSAANTVTVRFNNYSSGTVNPASGTFKVFVTK